MRYPHCKGGCGSRLLAQSEPGSLFKGGRRREYRVGYCEPCWTERFDPLPPPPTIILTPAQQAVLALLEQTVADEAERRDFANILGLVGEPA